MELKDLKIGKRYRFLSHAGYEKVGVLVAISDPDEDGDRDLCFQISNWGFEVGSLGPDVEEVDSAAEPAYCECEKPDHWDYQTYYRVTAKALKVWTHCRTCGKPISPVWTWKDGDPKPTKMPKGCEILSDDGYWCICTDAFVAEDWKRNRRWNILRNPRVFEPVAEPQQDGRKDHCAVCGTRIHLPCRSYNWPCNECRHSKSVEGVE